MKHKLVFASVEEEEFDFNAAWDVVKIDVNKMSITYTGTGKNEGLSFIHNYSAVPEEFERLANRYHQQLESDQNRLKKDLDDGKITVDEYEKYFSSLVPFELFEPETFIDRERTEEE